MVKIVIDAGHGGKDPGAVFEGRQEKDDNLRLALAVGKILQDNGEDVIYTRTADVYQTPFQKAMIANDAGADYFVSIHRNSSEKPNQYSGVETLVYDDSGIKAEMAEAVNQELEEVGFKNLGVKERPGLVVLRRTKMPAILIEAGFINNKGDNQLFDERFNDIAQGIADGILDTISKNGGDPTYYRVQTGLFRRKENAQKQQQQLQSQGFPAFIINEDGYYKVQVGAFQIMDNAIRMEATLRRYGYPTYLTT